MFYVFSHGKKLIFEMFSYSGNGISQKNSKGEKNYVENK